MTRIVPTEEAQRLLDTPNSPEGAFDWDYSYTNTYGTNFLDAGPDLAHTVIIRTHQVTELQKINGYKDRIIQQQEQQIARLQHAVDHAIYHNVESVEDVTATGIITAKDMEP